MPERITHNAESRQTLDLGQMHHGYVIYEFEGTLVVSTKINNDANGHLPSQKESAHGDQGYLLAASRRA
jgi:hypothetical protein